MTEDSLRKQVIVQAVHDVFAGENGEIVLEYLTHFTMADMDLFQRDSRFNDYMQGRRSVMLEIRKLLRQEVKYADH